MSSGLLGPSVKAYQDGVAALGIAVHEADPLTFMGVPVSDNGPSPMLVRLAEPKPIGSFLDGRVVGASLESRW